MTDFLCDRVGCEHSAAATPVFYFRCRPFGKAATGAANYRICIEHTETATVEDFINTEEWEEIVKGFRVRGLTEPIKDLTELGWVFIS